MKIIYGPDKTIYGVQPSGDFSITNTSINKLQNNRQYREGDAVYNVPLFQVDLSLQKGLDLTTPLNTSSVDGTTVSESRVILDKFDIPSFSVSSVGGWGESTTGNTLVNSRVLISSKYTDRDEYFDYDIFTKATVQNGTETLTERGGRLSVVSVDSNSLAFHINSNVLQLIDGKTPSATNRRLFSSISAEGSGTIDVVTATRNVNSITSSYDMCATSVWTASSDQALAGQQLPAVLITPQHAFISHTTRAVGSKICWVTNNNQKRIRTITASYGVNGSWQVVTLDSPITDIQPFTIIPQNILDYLPSIRTYRRLIPYIAIGRNIGYGGYDGGAIGILALHRINGNYYDMYHPDFRDWTWWVSSGDSNNPRMLPIDGKMVLVGTAFYAGSGYSLNSTLTHPVDGEVTLEQALNKVGNLGYYIQRADLSNYPTYPYN